VQDLSSKVALLAYYVEGIARIACAIPDDYLARVYGRSLFLGVDAFIKLAPALKNELKRTGSLGQVDAEALKERIKKLTSYYESYYATVRDKFAAHQQAVDLVLLIEAWNEIDEATLRVLADDVADVWRGLEAGGAVSAFSRPAELDDVSTLEAFKHFVANSGTVRMGVDRVGMTRPNTVSMIPTGLFQEKAMRVITAFEGFRVLINSGLEQSTAQWYLPEKASVDLLVVDSCSLIDNLFETRPANGAVAAEDSLVTIWQSQGVKGAPLLAAFPRDVALEQQLRELRISSLPISTAMLLSRILSGCS
jgi:hypothetical protein